MRRIPTKNHWFLGLAACLALGGAMASLSAARAVTLRPAPTYSTKSLPMPALDRVIAKLAVEARSRTLADNSHSDLR
jgi:hypothetical protein